MVFEEAEVEVAVVEEEAVVEEASEEEEVAVVDVDSEVGRFSIVLQCFGYFPWCDTWFIMSELCWSFVFL